MQVLRLMPVCLYFSAIPLSDSLDDFIVRAPGQDSRNRIDSDISEDLVDEDMLAEVRNMFGDLRPLSINSSKPVKQLASPVLSYPAIAAQAGTSSSERMAPILRGANFSDGESLSKACTWIWSQYKDVQKALRSSVSKVVFISTVTMLIRDVTERFMDIPYICRSMVYCKYSGVLDEADMNVIIFQLYPMWRKLAVRESGVRQKLADIRERMLTRASESPAFSSLVQTLESLKSLSNLGTQLDVFLEEPGTDFEDVLQNFEACLRVIDTLVDKSAEHVPTGNVDDSHSSNASNSGSGSILKSFLDVLGMHKPSEIGRILVGSLPALRGSQGGISMALSPSLSGYLMSLISGDFNFRSWVRHEFQRRLAIFTVPAHSSVSVADSDFNFRRQCMRPINSFDSTTDFLRIRQLEKSGDIHVYFAMLDSGRYVLEAVTKFEVNSLLPTLAGQTRKTLSTGIYPNGQKAVSCISEIYMSGHMSHGGHVTEEEISMSTCADPILSVMLHRLGFNETFPNSIPDTILSKLKALLINCYRDLCNDISSRLTRDAQQIVANESARAFIDMVKVKPYQPLMDLTKSSEWDFEQRKAAYRVDMGFYFTASIVLSSSGDGSLVMTVVDGAGTYIRHVTLRWLHDSRVTDSRVAAEEGQVIELLDEYRVSLVILSCSIPRVSLLRRKLSDLSTRLSDPVSRQLGFSLGNHSIPERVALNLSSDASLKDFGMDVRIAVSLCRFYQSPLSEALSLWHSDPDKNSLFSYSFHPLQFSVEKDILQQTFENLIVTLVNEIGVDVNECIVCPHRGSLLQFVSGLGPEAASRILKTADSVMRGLERGSANESLPNMSARSAKFLSILGENRWRNAQPFLRLCADSERLLMALIDTRSRLKSRVRNEDFAGMSVKSLHVSKAEWLKALDEPTCIDLLSVPRESWPVLLAVLDTIKTDVLASFCDKSLSSRLEVAVIQELVTAMYSSPDLPIHLADPEVNIRNVLNNAVVYIIETLIPALQDPYGDKRPSWKELSDENVFQLTTGVRSDLLSPLTPRLCRVVKDDGKWASVRVVDLNVNGSIRKPPSSERWSEGDKVLARVVSVDFPRLSVNLSIESPSNSEIDAVLRQSVYCFTLVKDRHIGDLGKIRQEVVHSEASRRAPRSRRVIRHDNYADLDYSAALVKLKDCPVGDVLFRPSQSRQGVLIGMIKIRDPADLIEGQRLDWVKCFTLIEEMSARLSSTGAARIIYRLEGEKDEFEELDQIKAVFVERYLRYMNDFKNHPRFRSERLEKVRNLVNAIFLTDAKRHVAYHLALDERPEFSGEGLLLWCSESGKVKEEPVQITHKGFKLWNRGVFASVNQMLAWWKSEGFSKRMQYLAEWQDAHYKKKKEGQ